ncbi:hypothetical protein ABL78_3544 [Leptomonas seymouri]|uniref:CRAL-TRIO domain-containing protein n=1 Tax=Leptomonas seymouri TaxID=5684 RepID=A0A0N0P689_LEPSE|nr:hypothetical protein ABL78_3544 [Leptomonas seymouri]|eukprot:KPI87356.1 hypothetical protein ABL78_3544 [Leptomonas seymouri]
MKGDMLPVTKLPGVLRGWEAQYEEDFVAQKMSGPIVFTEEQRQKNREVLRCVSDLLPFEDAYKRSDCDLIYRFLIGKHWNVQLAEKALREYIELRKKERMDGLIGEHLHPTIEAALCPCYSNGTPCPIYGLDKAGLPILWLSPDASKVIAAMKQFTDEQLVRGQMRATELGRFVCRARGVDRCIYVIDLGGITMSSVNKATLGCLKGVMNVLQIAYPEIMRRLLIFNTGWAVSAAWKVLRPFVDVRVQDKIKFESGAPTLAALQPYMEADQVHPAFGGTGKENLLDPLIEAEVRRVRGLSEGELRCSSTSPPRGPSSTWHDNGSLSDADPRNLHSFYCSTPNDSSCNRSPGSVSPPLDRMVIGVPRAVSAWMANMGREGEGKYALDSSLSVDSSSSDNAVGSAEENASRTASLKADAVPYASSSPLKQKRRASVASPTTRTAAINASSPLSTGEPFRGVEPVTLGGAQEKELPIVAISLTYGADGSITGYCGQKCVGHFRNGYLYASPKALDSDSTDSRMTSPSTANPELLSVKGANRRSVSDGQRSDQQQQQFRTSRGVPPIGELLYEAGHPIHNFYIVCDDQRQALYLVRCSRLRTRLLVYNVVGGAPVRTEKNSRHYVEGERAKLGVVVPSTDPKSNSKGNWMLYGEDVTQRSPGQHIKDFFFKPRRGLAAATDGSGRNNADKEKDAGWPTSIFAAMRSSAASTAMLPSKRKSRGAALRGTDDAVSAEVRSPGEATRNSCASDSDGSSGGAKLLAENKGQTVYFYNFLTKSPLSDLFALAAAITLSWSGELESLKGKPSSKTKSYAFDDEDLIT